MTERNATSSNSSARGVSRQPLTDLQQAILDVIWADGVASADRVRQAIAPAHQLKDSTVRTLLRRLEARGYLTHRVVGKVFVYQAAVRPHSVAARAVQQIIERFWAGSVERFLVGMVDEEVLSASEIRKLARKIGRQKKER